MCNAQLTPQGVWGHILRARAAVGARRKLSEFRPSGRLIRHGPTTYEWDIRGSCESPRGASLLARPWRDWRHSGYFPGHGRLPFDRKYASAYRDPIELVLRVPCRKCASCRRFRAAMWAVRGSVEAQASTRMWFGTLTFRPDEVFAMQWRAERALRKRSVAWEQLSPLERWERIQVQAGRYVTLWLKRLRKAGYQFRYLIACERHKSGVPHFHIVLHELASPVAKRALQSRWAVGFSKFKLVPSGDENRAVRYVTKYVAKDATTRLRASIRYGVAGKASAVQEFSVGTLVRQWTDARLDKRAAPSGGKARTDPTMREMGNQVHYPGTALDSAVGPGNTPAVVVCSLEECPDTADGGDAWEFNKTPEVPPGSLVDHWWDEYERAALDRTWDQWRQL